MFLGRLKLDKDDLSDTLVVGQIRIRLTVFKNRIAAVVIYAPPDIKITRERPERRNPPESQRD